MTGECSVNDHTLFYRPVFVLERVLYVVVLFYDPFFIKSPKDFVKSLQRCMSCYVDPLLHLQQYFDVFGKVCQAFAAFIPQAFF